MEGYQHPLKLIFLYMVFLLSPTMQPNLPKLSAQDSKGALHIVAEDHWCIYLHNHPPFLEYRLLALKAALFH